MLNCLGAKVFSKPTVTDNICGGKADENDFTSNDMVPEKRWSPNPQSTVFLKLCSWTNLTFRQYNKMLHTVSLLLLVSTSIMAEEEKERAECIMWSHLENKTMPLQDQGRYERNVNYLISAWSMVINSLLWLVDFDISLISEWGSCHMQNKFRVFRLHLWWTV